MQQATANDYRNLTIYDIDRGFLVEQVNEHLAQIVADIADLNKEPTKKRSVNVEIIFAASKSRRDAQVSYKVTLKPSTHIERESQTVFIAKDKDGNPIAMPFDPKQQVLFDADEPVGGAQIADKENN